MVRILDDFKVVLYDDDGVAAMDEGIEGKEQLADVVEVQSRRGLVEDEDGGLRLLHTEVIGKLDALVLATGQGG